METLIVRNISTYLPSDEVNTHNWDHLQNVQLADPDFHHPAGIDILVGAELYYDITNEVKRSKTLPGAPVAISSTLGWLVGGGRSNNHDRLHQSVTQLTTQHGIENMAISQPTQHLDEIMKKFWEIESVPNASTMSNEEKQCKEHFKQTFSRDETGRFIVRYPFKAAPSTQLGESLTIATRRFKQVERRLQNNLEHKLEYTKFMQEYESLGHMVEVPPPTSSSEFRCYLPHHFVLKESSTTTKFRIVFDASAKTSNGVSLNDIMMVGPVIQDSLANLIMRFRTHKIAITADIHKMYRQILVHPEDQVFQHIVWREGPNMPLKHYKLLTVTYGTADGAHLATETLHTLAEIEETNFPIAAKALKEDFYMDDLLSGADSEENAILLQQQLIQLLSKAAMSIRKFTSNSERVLQSLPEELRETKSLTFDTDAGIKALGIFWNPSEDSFGFKTNFITNPTILKLTKRNILSEVSMLFDPIGWLSPVVIKSKILMQSIWKEDIGWDEEVPDHIKQNWGKYKVEMNELQQLKIPRAQLCNAGGNNYLVGFSDASEQAYSAVVYLCTYNDKGQGSIQLVASKTRVAPVKQLTLPRLELSGSVLLSELMPIVAEALKIKLSGMYTYTDSTLVLRWIRSQPYKYKTFVANRISMIQERIPEENSGFVQGIENPADSASRGISVQELIKHPLWWNGPIWLAEGHPKARFPPDWTKELDGENEERRAIMCHTTNSNEPYELFSKYSSFYRLQRITAHLLRFSRSAVFAANKWKPPHTVNWLTVNELHVALLKLISLAQQEEFAEEIWLLQNNKRLSNKSKILPLTPFLDKWNILRVGGRLKNANIPLDQKHPILLPKNHKLTSLIIQEAHLQNMHAGPQALLSFLQQRYWIIRGKDAVRKVIDDCVVCTRHKAETMQQVMANLPTFRVNPSHPFQNCGVDYTGHFLIKPITPRSKTTLKAYIAIFICCVTRAIHLEVVSSATTDAFIAALRRFISRRGKPSNMYSDNGTNFVGANNEIQEFLQLTNSDEHNQAVATTMSKDGINWHFQPPSSPHFGGLWESGVKSTKYHLRRVMGLNRLTFEELTTLTTQIEAILNSRPITPESTDPSDLRALTPGHFLIGQPLTTIPDPDLTEIATNRLVRWQLVQQMLQQFWKRWSSEYINRLQQRPKWLQPKEEVKEGSMVIIKDDNLPPLYWKLGRVISIHPGSDDHVRVVTVKTATGELKRPIVKLCLLPIETNAPTTEPTDETKE